MELIDPEQGRLLLVHARRAIERSLGVEAPPASASIAVSIQAPLGGLFTTLTTSGELRGCVGYVHPVPELVELVERAAVAASREDDRFSPVRLEELSLLRISLSILAPPEPVDGAHQVEVGRDGLIVDSAGRRGLLLPEVAAERDWDEERFLAETCLKAGLPADRWKSEGALVQSFQTQRITEEIAPST